MSIANAYIVAFWDKIKYFSILNTEQNSSFNIKNVMM